MHRANQVDAQIDDREARVKVTEKMWGFKRPFTAEVVEQYPDEHIKWNSTEGTKHTGVINFHELGPRLTLIEANVDHSPSGLLEKLARGARFVKRAVRADFHRYQAWIEMKSADELAELEGWRGTIEGGEIVTSHEDALHEEQPEEEGEYEEEPEVAEEEVPPVAEEEVPPVAEEEAPPVAEEEAPEAAEAERPEAAEAERPEAAEEEAAPAARPSPARPRTRQQPSRAGRPRSVEAHRSRRGRRG
jgi:outer membrane biosynthesis protein TonB